MPNEPPLTALRLPPGPAAVATLQWWWDRGSAVLPLPPDQAAAEQLVAALRPTAMVVDGAVVALDHGVCVPPGTALVVATSGSTGAAKGVVLSHAALRASAQGSLERLGVDDRDRWLCCLPLHHVAGLQVLLRSALTGVAPVVHPRFDVGAVEAQRDVTLVALVPTMLRRLLDAGVDLSHLRAVLLGGGDPGARLLADAAAAGVTVVTTYGMTETCGGCVYDGTPLNGVEARIGDDGLVRLRGAVLFDGYRLRPDLTRAAMDGDWLVTADLGRFEGSRLQVVGRADDVIVTGGENVPAAQVAEILERHPGVAEAAVFGREDPEWGQRVVAVVVAAGQPPSLAALRDHVGARAGRHAAPRELLVVDALPRLDSGKVDRTALQRLA